jgi:hypothetical protein
MGEGLKRVAKQCGGLIATDGKTTVRYAACACAHDDALGCAHARHGDTDEPCECQCHDEYDEG